jgi:hypothetical protein
MVAILAATIVTHIAAASGKPLWVRDHGRWYKFGQKTKRSGPETAAYIDGCAARSTFEIDIAVTAGFTFPQSSAAIGKLA